MWEIDIASAQKGPSAEKLGGTWQVVAAQDLERGLGVRDCGPTHATDPARHLGPQVGIPRLSSHPTQCLHFLQQVETQLARFEHTTRTAQQTKPADFESEEAPLERVHQPFAIVMRGLEDKLHTAINQAAARANARSTRRTQVSDDLAGDSDDDDIDEY